MRQNYTNTIKQALSFLVKYYEFGNLSSFLMSHPTKIEKY